MQLHVGAFWLSLSFRRGTRRRLLFAAYLAVHIPILPNPKPKTRPEELGRRTHSRSSVWMEPWSFLAHTRHRFVDPCHMAFKCITQ